ncbi:MAG: WG repeat-containing protein [Bacteroidota bacterium]
MTTRLTACLVFFGMITLQAQNLEVIDTPDGKHGLKLDNGRVLIPARYDDYHLFQENISAVKLDNKWGFVDVETGTEIIAPKYESVGDFAEGLAAVQLNGKWGFCK